MEQDKQQRQDKPDSDGDSGTRDKIIAAALDEFVAHGKAGARVDRIASAAGVNKAMIYYHFNSKENLYLEVVKSFYIDMGQRASRIVSETMTLEEGLLALVDLHVQIFHNNQKLRRLLLRELADPKEDILDSIARAFDATGLAQTIRGRLAEGIAAGRIRQADDRQLIVAFISLSIGYFFIYPIVDRVLNIEDNRTFVEERKSLLVDIFMNGIKAR